MPGRVALLSPERFTEWALGVLREDAPDLKPRFAAPDVLTIGGGKDELQLGLQNLRALAREADLPDAEVRRTLLDRARAVHARPALPSSWDEVRPLLRPQLMPAEYVAQAPAPLLHRLFHSGVVAGVVVDRPQAYSYVRVEDCAAWGAQESGIWRAAIENLDEASRDLRVELFEGPDRFLAVSMQDGYDAARLLVPGIRAFLAERLGEPFFAGTPNRDFLVAWASDCTDRFWEFVQGKLAKDCAEQPYPLTAAMSVATRDSVQAGARRR